MLTARKLVSTGLVALTIAGVTIATASQAEAHNYFGAGLATGLIGGALATAAITQPYGPPPVAYRYGPPVYGYRPYGPPPVYTGFVGGYPHCHVAWHENGYGRVYPVRACAAW